MKLKRFSTIDSILVKESDGCFASLLCKHSNDSNFIDLNNQREIKG